MTNIKLTYDYTLNSIKVLKASRLDWAIRSIAAAVILLGLDEIITISIPVLQKM
jgi:branched-subunit amino acid permease